MIYYPPSTIHYPLIRIGVTGGIGSGKSTVCKIFESLGIPVFHSDDEGRRLLSEDKHTIYELIKLFGESALTDGKPDRSKIASIVFNEPEKLEQLNAIIHPAVRKKFAEWCELQTSNYVINEAAILFETGSYQQLDKTILVVSPEALRIERVMKRTGMKETDIQERMKNQWSDNEKRKIADYIIVNDETTMLIPQVVPIHKQLIAKDR